MNKFVVISDIHYPYQDEEAIKAFLRFIKANPVDTVIMNGDILDMYDCSSFDKNPDRINSLQEELNLATKFFGKLRKILPDAEIVFIRGNHEFRLERYLMKHPELFSLDALKLPNLLRLRDFNIGYEPKAFKLGSLKITHGSIVRKFSGYTAHAELDKNDCSGISGHCFSEDVEILTKSGWKRVIDTNIGDMVATINKGTKSFEWNEVRDKFVYDNYQELYHIKSSVIDLMVTDKHGLVGYNKSNSNFEEFTAYELYKSSKRYKFLCAAEHNNFKGIELSDDLIRLLVNISTDGCIEGNAIRFHLKKERKINHLRHLLNVLSLEYTETIQSTGNTKFYIKTSSAKPIIDNYFSNGKYLPEILKDVNTHQANIILQEYAVTDGNKNKDAINSYQIATKKLQEVNLLQEIFCKNNIRSSVIERKGYYCITANTRNLTDIDKDNVSIVPYEGKVSCVSVDNGTLIVRSKGKVVITQNTHRGGAYFKQTPSRYLAWYEGFCLCDIHPEYVENPNWQQGFLYGYVNKDSFAINPIPIVDGKIKCPFYME